MVHYPLFRESRKPVQFYYETDFVFAAAANTRQNERLFGRLRSLIYYVLGRELIGIFIGRGQGYLIVSDS